MIPGLNHSRAHDFWLAGIVVILDQAAKAIVRPTLDLHASVTVVPGLMDFTHVRNTGAAFGILNAADFPFKAAIIALVATLALIGVGFYAAALPAHQRAARLGSADHIRFPAHVVFPRLPLTPRSRSGQGIRVELWFRRDEAL